MLPFSAAMSMPLLAGGGGGGAAEGEEGGVGDHRGDDWAKGLL